MPKLLLICDVYPPSFAPRMGYLVKYVKDWDWNADIVTRGHDGDFSFQSLLGDEKVLRVQGVKTPIKTTKDKVSRLINQKSHHIQNGKLMTRHILNNLDSKDYKLILCSTAHRTFLLDVAYQVAKEWEIPWIADIRDLYEQNPKTKQVKKVGGNHIFDYFNKSYHQFSIKKRNKTFYNANAMVTISPWHVDQIKKYNTNTNLIYNGYCPEQFYVRPQSTQSIFKISYMGLVISNELRDPTLLFLAVKKLVIEKNIDKANFRIQFYTPKNKRNPILNNPAYQDISDFVDFYDYVDTAQVPQILAGSSILLLLTNVFKPDGPKGIMTTKYFEYLAMERPIICVRSDENILEESILKANAGVSARTVEETYDFLLEKWKEWKEKEFTTVEVNKEYTQQFSRKLQAKQFVDLFEKVNNNEE